MRADRLLMLIMLLQTRGKLTATTLAEELGVSRRTILRDVDALSLAGVPVYAEGGHGGGIALDENYRTSLNGLHTSEVQALFVANTDSVLRDVGLNEAAQQVWLKLIAGLPTSHRLTAEHIQQRVMIDPTWWWHDSQTPAFWDDLQRAVYEDYLIDMTYEHYNGDMSRGVLAPHSLVNKASHWYLVTLRDDDFRTYRVTRFHQVTLLDKRFTRRTDFNLQHYWQDQVQAFTERVGEYRCTLRVHPDRVPFVKWLTTGRWEVIGESDDGWQALQFTFDTDVLAKMLVFGLGTHCNVVAPPELAQSVVEDARMLLQHFGS